MTGDATARVRAAIAAGTAPARKDLEHALRESLGLSARMARRFCAEGAKAISAPEQIDAAAVLDGLRGLLRSFDDTKSAADTDRARPAFDTNGASSTLKDSTTEPVCDTHDER